MKQLVIIRENKDQALEFKGDLVANLACMIPCDHLQVMEMGIRLMAILANDCDFRGVMVEEGGLVSKVVGLFLLQDQKLVGQGDEDSVEKMWLLRLLYALSIDDKIKSVLTYTDLLPHVSLSSASLFLHF